MSKKNIFPYTRNGEQVYGDPIKLYRRLMRACVEAGFQFHQIYTSAFPEVEEGQPEPHERTVEPREKLYFCVCDAFGLTPFDEKTGEGTLIDEAEGVLFAFLAFMEQKKNGDGK